MEKEKIKSLLSATPQIVDITELNASHIHRLRIHHTSANFESFFMPSKSGKKLYVCLTGHIGTNKVYPLFDRPTWSNEIDANFLCMDDPSKEENNHVCSTYWFGSKNENYLDHVVDIVEKFKEIYYLDNSDVFFTSNSNGGFACIYCCNKMEGSNCIVFNPQFYVRPWQEKKRTGKITHDIIFQDIFGINFEDETYQHRLNLDYIKNNYKSKFFIYINQAGKDKAQLDMFVKDTCFDDSLILQKIQNNIILYTPNIPAKEPHVAFPFDYSSMVLFENTLQKEEITQYDCYLYRMLANYLVHYYSVKKKQVEFENELDTFITKDLQIPSYDKNNVFEVIKNYYKHINDEKIENLKKLINQKEIRLIDSYHDKKSWYRIWSDGFCEQGGIIQRGSSLSSHESWNCLVELHKPYVDTSYSVFTSATYTDGTNNNASSGSEINTHSKLSNSFCCFYYNRNAKMPTNSSVAIEWKASGYIF